MDPRATRAREHHRRAAQAEQRAVQHRGQRDRIIRQLRTEDPARWTYAAIATAVGCSPELVAAVVKGNTRRRQAAGEED
jgi:AraC-like DNA-binding protein